MDLPEFLVRAKKATWASGSKPRSCHLDPGFEEFTFVDSDSGLVYVDRYHAEDPKPFGGRETVFQRGKLLWMMNYFGGMREGVDIKAVNDFLRNALSNVPKHVPFRGPPYLVVGDREYHNDVQGDVRRFKGQERILFAGKEVFQLDYMGGEV